MKLKKLTASFGSLQKHSLELKDGLNVIVGPNESGKSTWCAFIRAMLFGVDSSQRDTKQALAEKNRFRPWGGAPMEGTMSLEADARELTVERRSSANMPMRELQVFDGGGEPVRADAAFGETLIGCGRETFEKSAFIERPELPQGGGELEERILSLVSTGDDSYSYSDADSRLKEMRNKLRFNKRGEIPVLEQQIAGYRQALTERAENETALSETREEIARLELEVQKLDGIIALHIRSKSAGDRKKLEEARNVALAARAKVDELGRTLPDADEFELRGMLEALQSRSTEADTAEVSRLKRELVSEEERLSNSAPFLGCSSDNASLMVTSDVTALRQAEKLPKGKFAVMALVFIVSLALWIISLNSPQNYLSLIAAGVIVLTMIYVMFDFMRRRAAARRIYRKYGADAISDITIALETYRGLFGSIAKLQEEVTVKESDMRSSSQRYYNAASKAGALFGGAKLQEDLIRVINEALGTIDEYEQAAEGERTASAILQTLITTLGIEPGEIEESETAEASNVQPEIPEMPLAEAESAHKQALASLAERQKTASYLEGVLSDRTSVSARYELERAEERLEFLRGRIAALELAIETLSEANNILRERFSPALNARAAEIFSAFTGGKYDRVSITREFTALAGEDTSAGMHRSLELSRGTADQLWLAVRLAICDVVLPADKNIPVILDDALVTFDDNRMGLVLDFLRALSADRQIMLFTCQEREAAYLKDSDANIIRV